MTTEIDEIVIKGITYVPKGQENEMAKSCSGLPYVLIRTYSAGVHFGYLKKRGSTLAGIEVELIKARRVYYWEGAASLSQMAMEGVKSPDKCKISMEVESIELLAIEIIPITSKAEIILKGVALWKK